MFQALLAAIPGILGGASSAAAGGAAAAGTAAAATGAAGAAGGAGAGIASGIASGLAESGAAGAAGAAGASEQGGLSAFAKSVMNNFPAGLNPKGNLSDAFPFSRQSSPLSGTTGALGVPIPSYNASNEAGNASNLAGQALRSVRNSSPSNGVFPG